MPAQTGNPFALDVTGSVSFGDKLEQQRVLTEIVQEANRVDQDRAGWFERQKALTKLRYCMRPKIREFPWKGASNLGIPFIDVVIRKYKPTVMRLVTDADPVVEFVGQDQVSLEHEREAEAVYEWLFKVEMDSIEPIAYMIDTMAHRGHAFLEVGWDYRTEYQCRVVPVASIFPQGPPQDPNQIMQALLQHYEIRDARPSVQRILKNAADRIAQGAQFVKVASKKVISNRPALYERDPVQVIMPERETDPENAEWIVVQHILSLRKVRQLEADGIFAPGTAKKIGDEFARRSASDITRGADTVLAQSRQLQDERERIYGTEDEGNVLVWHIYHWHDIDNDGMKDRVDTWLHPSTMTLMASRPYLMPFSRWPLEPFTYEKTNRRWHAPRGISQMLEGLQREVNFQHNARIDGMTLRNAPTFQMPVLAGFKSRNFRAVPGTIIHVPGGAEIKPIVHDRAPFSEQVAEENLLRQIGEDYIGTLDAVLGSAGSVTSARTATEVQAALQFAQSNTTLDATLFQNSMRKVHEMVWQLFLDLGPPEVYARVLDSQAGHPVGKILRKADIAHKYKLIPTGTIANTNRALELAHAREALQLYLNDQSGFINPHELRRWHLNLLDYRRARRILNSPDQAAELQTIRQAADEYNNNPEVQAAIAGGVTNVPPEVAEAQRIEFLPRSTIQ